ncbi:MAG: GH3 auxin-responsive promoter family protein [Peptostreptococcaceae bacterium]|nr:GH3 auxin-responsive promoter family protein [Peptostreptococcaceae bacterium]
MNYRQKLNKNQHREIWYEYCNFLDLSIDEYMTIQNRLMEEQMQLWLPSGIGQKFAKGKSINSIDDFRKQIPLTTYIDYADILIGKKNDMLPVEPVIWLQTTWEGGKHPLKVAPYTAGMLDIFKNNLMTISTLASSNQYKKTKLQNGDKVLFGLAPLPYVTGLFPLVFEEEIDFEFLPPIKDALNMSFGERNKIGFSMGMERGIDVFFGMSSVIHYITENFSNMLKNGSSSHLFSKILRMSPVMIARFIKAKYVCKKEGRAIKPSDLFKLKALVCAGTDTASYKESLKEAWGVDPLEAFAGTEVSLLGTETLLRNGMVFFPDNCFYEFIPEEDVYKNMDNPSYVPRTFLMNELMPGHNYELVVTVFKGGAFSRYRVGDMFRCVSTTGDHSTSLPKLISLDRVSEVIDIAGFTRITENSISDIIRLSGISIKHWVAKKEYDSKRRPFLHLYIEMPPDNLHLIAVNKQLIKEHLEAYFKYFDTDYNDLKKMLGIEPLQIDLLKCGTIDTYFERTGKTVRRMNPSDFEIFDLLEFDSYKCEVKKREDFDV